MYNFLRNNGSNEVFRALIDVLVFLQFYVSNGIAHIYFIIIIIISDTRALCGPWPSSEVPSFLSVQCFAPPILNSQCPYVLSDTVFPSHLRSSNFPGPLWCSLKYLLHCSLVTSTQYMSSLLILISLTISGSLNTL